MITNPSLDESISDQIKTIQYFRESYISLSDSSSQKNILIKMIDSDIEWKNSKIVISTNKSLQSYSTTGWLRNKESDSIIIFIHGFISSNTSAWMSKNDVFWPKLLCDYNLTPSPNIYLFDYKSELFSKNYSIQNIINYFHNKMSLEDIIRHKKIVFVCHSMGGIIALSWLNNNFDNINDKKFGLLFLGVPLLGSKLANCVGKLLGTITTKQLNALKTLKMNDFLKNIITNCKIHFKNKPDSFIGCEFYEDGRFPIVHESLTGELFTNPIKLQGSNHFSLAKIDSENDDPFKQLIYIYKKIQKPAEAR